MSHGQKMNNKASRLISKQTSKPSDPRLHLMFLISNGQSVVKAQYQMLKSTLSNLKEAVETVVQAAHQIQCEKACIDDAARQLAELDRREKRAPQQYVCCATG